MVFLWLRGMVFEKTYINLNHLNYYNEITEKKNVLVLFS